MSDGPDRRERRDGERPAEEGGADEAAPEGEPSRIDRAPQADRREDEDEEEWAISLSDLREREEADELAQLREADPEPGTVSAENAAFVLLGAVVCMVLLYVGFL